MTELIRHQRTLPSLTAGLIIGVLGLNVWAMLLVVPVLHALSAAGSEGALPLWLLFAPLPLLALGGFRRSRVMLLALYPISLGILNASFRGHEGPGIFTAWTFALAALSLFGFLVGSTIVLEVQARQDDALGSRPLFLPPLSGRWRRRRRVYAILALFAAAIPLSFIYTIDFHPSVAETLKREHGASAEEMQTLLVVMAMGLWLWLFHTFFMVPLEQHRRGDRDIHRELALVEKRSLGRPRAGFYLMVVLALLLMGLLLWLRRRYG